MEDRKKLILLIVSFSLIIIGLALLALWNVSLVEEIKTSSMEREDLKKNIEKIEILEKASRSFIKDVLRQKAIALCFLELIGEYEIKYTSKEKQDCIQLIVMTDEKYGNKGINAPLILAWLEKESNGNPEAVSDAGAKGLTQLMDYRAWKVLDVMGYPGYEKKLVYNPVVNLAGGLYHLNSLLNFWEWKGIEDQSLVLFYTLYSYKWGTENAEKLYNTDSKASKAVNQYVNLIFKRREYWAQKLKYWIDDAQKLADKSEKAGSGENKE